MKQLLSSIGIIFVVGLLILSFQRKLKTSDWPETHALAYQTEILERVDWKTKKLADGTKIRKKHIEYQLKVLYRYNINGKEYTGQLHSDESNYRSVIENQQRRLQQGDKIAIKYNPQTPSDHDSKW